MLNIMGRAPTLSVSVLLSSNRLLGMLIKFIPDSEFCCSDALRHCQKSFTLWAFLESPGSVWPCEFCI